MAKTLTALYGTFRRDAAGNIVVEAKAEGTDGNYKCDSCTVAIPASTKTKFETAINELVTAANTAVGAA